MAGPHQTGGSCESMKIEARLRCAIPAVLTGIVLGIFLAASAPGQDQGLALLHKMQHALGGADAIAAIHYLDWTVQAVTFDREGKVLGSVTRRTRWITELSSARPTRPGRYLRSLFRRRQRLGNPAG
jgi:hypothetical protein